MNLRQFARLLAAVAIVGALGLSQANAQWTITTYKRAPQTPPPITSMAIADQYFTGALPSRFMGTSTVTHVNLFESGGAGQFTDSPPNNPQFPFPGVDANEAAGDTADFTARVTGTLVVAAANSYHFFTDSDDGNRFRLDINQNGTYEDATESIVPDGGLQGTGAREESTGLRNGVTDPGYYPNGITLNPGNYNFEISFYERGGGGSIDAGYRRGTTPTQVALGDPRLGISLLAPAQVKTVGAAVGPAPPAINNFTDAAALRNAVQGPGFPATGVFEVFNIQDSGGDGDFLNDSGAPGLGAPNANDDDDFVVVGRGHLIVPAGGITGAVFRSNTDDGGRLLIDINRDGDFGDAGEFVINRDVLQGDTNTDSAPVTLAAGRYATEYSWFERGGGGQGEVSVRLTTGGPFTLLGDNAAVAAGTGLEVGQIPEPSTMLLVGLSLVGLAGLARRRK
jgi:hypothetical protein